MNRVINNPDLVVEDMLKGILCAHAELEAVADNPRVIKRRNSPTVGKVGIVTGGGSGHEPAFLGYVGETMVDAVAVGEIFSSPTAKSFFDAIKAADGGAGVACLYGNYAGDNMNVKMADRVGIPVKTVVANDDVPSAPKGDEAKRRGVAGEILMWKTASARAALGGSLDEVIAVAQKCIDRTRSIGIGLSSCVIPAVGKANFHIDVGKIEVGIGHHGEPGINVSDIVPADQMAKIMVETLLPDLPFTRGDRVAVLVSGLGATPLMEQYILYGEIAKHLQGHGITVVFNQVGNLFTSLEMMGVTLTIMKLDAELEECLKRPCRCIGMTVVGDLASAGHIYSGVLAATGISPLASVETQTVTTARTISGSSVVIGEAGRVVHDLISTINANRAYLSEIDGLIGDGDHGINMSKGFMGCGIRMDALGRSANDLSKAFEQLSLALMDDIGGSMGPLYGSFFLGFAKTLGSHTQMDAVLFGEALGAAVANVQEMGNAQVGDKTLIDAIVPALAAYRASIDSGANFSQCLQAMSEAAATGRDSTKDLQARIGRSARLGARSIGVLDAGATSSCLILQSISSSLQQLVAEQYM